LHLGDLDIVGVIENVWNYQVSGMHVVKKWIGYRKASPSTKWSSPLNEIVTESWPKAWTDELSKKLLEMNEAGITLSGMASVLGRTKLAIGWRLAEKRKLLSLISGKK
jgi:hypothetical protein